MFSTCCRCLHCPPVSQDQAHSPGPQTADTHTHTHTHSHTSVGGANGAPVRHAVKRGPTLQANISATKQDIDMVLSDKQTSDNPEVNGLVYSRFLNYGKIM